MPVFRVNLETCDGPMDLEGLVLEVNMWANAKLRRAITPMDTYFQLADNIGFGQVMVGDIIIMDRIRQPEHMLVTGFDEENHFIQVQRGYNGTIAGSWKKGSKMRVFRVLNSPAITESQYENVENLDGTTDSNVLTESYLIYEWKPEDTCLPGCYWLEFKLLKMKERQFFLPGGKWIGAVTQNDQDDYYTGTVITDGSVKVSAGIGDPYSLIRKIKLSLPSPLLSDPNFIIPVIPEPDDYLYNLWRMIVHLYPSPGEVQLRWQIWERLNSLYPQGEYYVIPSNVHWTGASHVWTDNNWYTGTTHTDGSVYLHVNGLANPEDASYNEDGIVSVLCDGCDPISGTPSFTPIPGIDDIDQISTVAGMSQIHLVYGCTLGTGVEWARRFPTSGEGFLIKIEDSPTTEF